MSKEKKSVTISPAYINLIEAHQGVNFSAKLDTVLKKYAAFCREKKIGFDPLEGLDQSADASDLDALFAHERKVFSELDAQNNQKMALEYIRRPVDDTTETGYGQAPVELLQAKIDALQEALAACNRHIKLISDLQTKRETPEFFLTRLTCAFNDNPELFKTQLTAILNEYDENIATALLTQMTKLEDSI